MDDGNALEFYQAGPAGDRGRLRVAAGPHLRRGDPRGRLLRQHHRAARTLAGTAGGFVNRPAAPRRSASAAATAAGCAIEENVLVLKAFDFADDSDRTPRPLRLYVGRTRYDLRASYAVGGAATYLYDLRGGLPDSVLTHDGRQRLRNLLQAVLPSIGDHVVQHP